MVSSRPDPGSSGTPLRSRNLARRVLQPERIEMLRARSDEGDAMLRQRFGETAIFREKAIARMHRLGAGRQACGNDRVDVEIALRGRRRADAHALVGVEHGPREAIGVGIDRDRCDPHAPQRSADPPGDFAAVGDQDLAEHAHQSSCASQITTWIGVGMKPLQGLLICGQLEIRQSTSISATSST